MAQYVSRTVARCQTLVVVLESLCQAAGLMRRHAASAVRPTTRNESLELSRSAGSVHLRCYGSYVRVRFHYSVISDWPLRNYIVTRETSTTKGKIPLLLRASHIAITCGT